MSAPTKVHHLSIEQLARFYRNGQLKPTEVTELMLERIEQIDCTLHSYVHVAHKHARQSAQRAESELAAGVDRGPLHGVPIAVKDIFFNDVMPTEVGMTQVPESWRSGTATLVERALASGAVILGAVATTEGVWTGYNPTRSAPRNPWGEELWSGASSSGPGVATAASLCFGAYGSESGGSIRIPAAASGVTGLRPTWGRVSRFGVAPLSPSLDHPGALARTARDIQLMLTAVEGYDPRDPTSSRARGSSESAAVTGTRGMTVGIDWTYVGDLPHEIGEALDAVLEALVGLGTRVIEIKLPDYRPAVEAWQVILATEAAGSHRDLFPDRRAEYGYDLAAILDQGLAQTAGAVAEANLVRTSYGLALGDVFEKVDLFICPVMAGLLPTVEEWAAASDEQYGSVTKFTAPHVLAGTPTITIPVALDSRGAPIGMQLCARSFQEGTLTNVATALQAVTDWHVLRPPV